MTNALDRRRIVELVNEALTAGARLRSICAELGIGENTYRRWSAGGEDQRPHIERTTPVHALTPAERQAVLNACHRPQFASLPPAQIVARLLDDEQRYLASESTFYRILHQAGEQRRRGRQAAPRHKGPPRRHRADGPNACWTWDVTYLPTQVRGQFLYLYLIIDIYSRKIVGHEVFDAESMANSATVIQRAVLREQCAHRPLVLHSDNGSAMKGSTIHAKLDELGITPSHSRPRVSNDNAYSEALFRTCKYRPEYPLEGFADLCVARRWVGSFVHWYNDVHRHSEIRYVTPAQRHGGLDKAILGQRHQIYQQAKAKHPARCSRQTRNWQPVGSVWLNPDKETVITHVKNILEAA